MRLFTNSAGALLLAVALAMFIANWSSTGLVQPQDPVLMVSMRILFWFIGAATLGIGLVCLFGKRVSLKIIFVCWLTMNLAVYQLGWLWKGDNRGVGVYLTSMADAFGITSNTAYWLLQMVFLYLLIGSSVSVLTFGAQTWMRKPLKSTDGYLKGSCPNCGGYIKYPPLNSGQKIPCPHCRSTIAL